MSDHEVTQSQFYMWRTLFAVAHADNIVTDEEVRFMAEALEDVGFSDEQRAVLNADSCEPQDIEQMFGGITDVQDQAVFFKFAHELVHIDGDYGLEEQQVMLKLKELHLQAANIDDLVGRVSLELEADGPVEEADEDAFANTVKKSSFKDRVYSSRDAFFHRRLKD